MAALADKTVESRSKKMWLYNDIVTAPLAWENGVRSLAQELQFL